jgi:CRP-like cAMP-binding protein
MKTQSLTETLAGLRFLQGTSQKHLEQIAAATQVRDYAAADVVFREGDVADSAYFVVSGKLSLRLSPATIYRKDLVTVGTGEMLGWSSLVANSHFAATAVAVEPTQLVRIDAKRLRAMCDDDPQFGYEFMRRVMVALAKRLLATWTQLSHLYVSPYLPATAPGEE